jgi:hypothetical protein
VNLLENILVLTHYRWYMQTVRSIVLLMLLVLVLFSPPHLLSVLAVWIYYAHP